MAATTSNVTTRKPGFDFAALAASAGTQDRADEVTRLREALATLAELVIAHGVMDARTLESIVGDLIAPPIVPVALSAPLPPPAPSASEAILKGGVPRPAAMKPVAPRPTATVARPAATPVAKPAPVAAAPVAAVPVAAAPVAATPVASVPVAAAPVAKPAPVAAAPVAATPVAKPVPVAAAPVAATPLAAAPVAKPAPVAAAPITSSPVAQTLIAPAPVAPLPAAKPAPVAVASVGERTLVDVAVSVPVAIDVKESTDPVVPPSSVSPVVASPFLSEPAPAHKPARRNPFDVKQAARLEDELVDVPPPSAKPQSLFSRLFTRKKASPAAVAKAAASVEFTERMPKLPADGLYAEQQRATELSFPPPSTVQRKPRAAAAAPRKKAERPANVAPARFCDRCWRRMDATNICKTCSPLASA